MNLFLTSTYRLFGLLVFTLLISGLTACNSLDFAGNNKTKIRLIRVSVAEVANQSVATDIDILFVMDKELVYSLPETAPEWFDDREQFLSVNDQSLLVASLQTVPSQTVYEVALPKGYKQARMVIAYANYLSAKGQNRLLLPNVKSAHIKLYKSDLIVE